MQNQSKITSELAQQIATGIQRMLHLNPPHDDAPVTGIAAKDEAFTVKALVATQQTEPLFSIVLMFFSADENQENKEVDYSDGILLSFEPKNLNILQNGVWLYDLMDIVQDMTEHYADAEDGKLAGTTYLKNHDMMIKVYTLWEQEKLRAITIFHTQMEIECQ